MAVASVITPKQITSTEDDSVRQDDYGTWGSGSWITE
jgi:hypothetical protein